MCSSCMVFSILRVLSRSIRHEQSKLMDISLNVAINTWYDCGGKMGIVLQTHNYDLHDWPGQQIINKKIFFFLHTSIGWNHSLTTIHKKLWIVSISWTVLATDHPYKCHLLLFWASNSRQALHKMIFGPQQWRLIESNHVGVMVTIPSRIFRRSTDIVYWFP